MSKMKNTLPCFLFMLPGFCCLVVIAGSTRVIIPERTYIGLPEGVNWTLPCEIEGISAPRVKWTQTDEQGNSREVQQFSNNPNFTITNLSRSDQGVYTCAVEGNVEGSAPAVSNPIVVLVTHPPGIRMTISSYGTPGYDEPTASATCHLLTEIPILIDTVWYRVDIKKPLGYEMIEVIEDEKHTTHTEDTNYNITTTLWIKNATIWDLENYVCAVRHYWNTHGHQTEKDDSNRKLHDSSNSYPVTEILTTSVNLTVPAESGLVLPCETNRAADHMVSWWKDGKKLTAGGHKIIRNSRISLNISENFHNLTIYYARRQDKGRYVCRVEQLDSFINVTHTVAARVSPTAWITVAEPTRDLFSPESIEIALGDSFALKCHVNGEPEPFINWTLKASQFGSKRYLPQFASLSNLTIIHANHTDAGEYSCEADNGVGEPGISYGKQIIVIGAASYAITVKAWLGGTASLKCDLFIRDSTLLITTTWFRIGNQRSDSTSMSKVAQYSSHIWNNNWAHRVDNRYTVQTKPLHYGTERGSAIQTELVIDSVSQEDLGKYVCHVKNTNQAVQDGVTLRDIFDPE